MDKKSISSALDDIIVLTDEILLDIEKKQEHLKNILSLANSYKERLNSHKDIESVYETTKNISEDIDKYLAIFDICPT